MRGQDPARVRMLRFLATGIWWFAWLLLPLQAASSIPFAMQQGMGDYGVIVLLSGFYNWASTGVLWLSGWAALTILLALYDHFTEDVAPLENRPRPE